MRLPLVSRKRYEAVKAERDELDAKLREAIRWHRESAQARADARRMELGIRTDDIRRARRSGEHR